MPKHKSVLKRLSVEVAKHRRTCRHDSDHEIQHGETSLVVREGLYQRRGYCRDCGLSMLKLARKTLAAIEKELGGVKKA